MAAIDAVVVGAGPAGLAAALAFRGAGVGVAVLEQHAAPPPRVCGAFVNPEGVSHLEALGLLPAVLAAGAVPVREAWITWPCGEARVRVERGGRAGLAVPRETLERVMVERVTALGGEVRYGARVAAVERQARGWAADVASGAARARLAATWLVAADGRFSSLSGRRVAKSQAGWFGWNAPFEGIAAPPGALSLHFGRDGYVGLLTFADGVTNVCGLTRRDGTASPAWAEALAASAVEQPALAGALGPARRTGAFRGVGPLPFSADMWRSDGPLVAGDAAAVGDPFMGEGISRALGTGPVLAAALAAGGTAEPGPAVERYIAAWRSRYHPRLRLGTAARWTFEHPRLSAPLLGLVLTHPALLDLVLSRAHDARG